MKRLFKTEAGWGLGKYFYRNDESIESGKPKIPIIKKHIDVLKDNLGRLF